VPISGSALRRTVTATFYPTPISSKIFFSSSGPPPQVQRLLHCPRRTERQDIFFRSACRPALLGSGLGFGGHHGASLKTARMMDRRSFHRPRRRFYSGLRMEELGNPFFVTILIFPFKHKTLKHSLDAKRPRFWVGDYCLLEREPFSSPVIPTLFSEVCGGPRLRVGCNTLPPPPIF